MPPNTVDDEILPPLQSRPTGIWAAFVRKLGLGPGPRRLPHDSVAFTSAFIALGAKMAVADGVAVKVEAQAFAKFLDVAPGQEANIRRLYDVARQDASGFEVYAGRLDALLGYEVVMKRDVLECLLYVACADGILHPAEDRFLLTVAFALQFSELEFAGIRAQFVYDAADPYVMLGLEHGASDSAVKARYRKLVAEHHPDKLIAAGATDALVKAANAKLAAINSAHESILKERASAMAST